MKQRDKPFWSLLPLPLWIAIFVIALIFTALYCWLATVYHWYGVAAAASSSWMQYLALAPESFVFSLIAMSALPIGLKRARLTSVPWYMQGDSLRGVIGVALVVLMVLNGISSVSDSIIIAVGQAICLLIIVAAFVWAFVAPTKKYEKVGNEQTKGLK